MRDLISRQAAIDEAYAVIVDDAVFDVVQVETLEALPSAERHARWEYVDYGGVGNWHCSACRAISPKKYNFCPTCGRDMRGDYQ